MDQDLKNSSYSDLFEDFFRTDAAAAHDSSLNSGGVGSVQPSDIFDNFMGSEDQGVMLNQIQTNNSDIYFMQHQQQPIYQQPQQDHQQQYMYQPQLPFIPTMMAANSSGIHKPGFIRNRTRKNMRQKSVATAVKASHMMASVGQAGSGIPLVQNYQPQVAQIPYYQVASQLPAYHQQQNQHLHQQQVQPQVHQVIQQPPMLLAKSPAAQAPLLRSNPPSPSSNSRSPNNTSSDYVKFRLQQKIRSRMVSKGQIPPNPTEEELRLCGMQIPNVQSLHQSQLPTPKSSPHQIPRAFNNNTAAFITTPSMMINNQQMQQIHQQQQLQGCNEQDDIFKYLDLNNYSQKDPLTMINNDYSLSNSKQQQQQKQQQSQQQQQEVTQTNNGINYDQFFSDFILY